VGSTLAFNAYHAPPLLLLLWRGITAASKASVATRHIIEESAKLLQLQSVGMMKEAASGGACIGTAA